VSSYALTPRNVTRAGCNRFFQGSTLATELLLREPELTISGLHAPQRVT
jgi:hypothetical protein